MEPPIYKLHPHANQTNKQIPFFTCAILAHHNGFTASPSYTWFGGYSSFFPASTPSSSSNTQHNRDPEPCIHPSTTYIYIYIHPLSMCAASRDLKKVFALLNSGSSETRCCVVNVCVCTLYYQFYLYTSEVYLCVCADEMRVYSNIT